MLNGLLDKYKNFPEVKAIAIGGSASAKTSDANSDIDVYVFVEKDIELEYRENIVKEISSKYEVGGDYFGSGDEYFVDSMHQQLDVMFWNVKWFEDIIDNVWIKHYPSNGYTTCFLYTLDICKIIYDTENWLQNCKNKINTPYPAELQQNIIRRNLMLLKDKPFASYYEQIKKALQRRDVVSVNHRLAAFLASYFDIIFAKNQLLHPGEKRLVQYAKENCKILPEQFEENINQVLNQPNSETLAILDTIVFELKKIL